MGITEDLSALALEMALGWIKVKGPYTGMAFRLAGGPKRGRGLVAELRTGPAIVSALLIHR
jgi:hypothetical protein